MQKVGRFKDTDIYFADGKLYAAVQQPRRFGVSNGKIELSDLVVDLTIQSDIPPLNPDPNLPASQVGFDPLPIYANASMDNNPTFHAVVPGTYLDNSTDADGEIWIRILVNPTLGAGSNTSGFLKWDDVQIAMSPKQLATNLALLKQQQADADKNNPSIANLLSKFFGDIPTWVPWAVGGIIAVPLVTAIVNASSKK